MRAARAPKLLLLAGALALGLFLAFSLGAKADPSSFAGTGTGSTGPSALTVARTDDPSGPDGCPSDCSLREAMADIGSGGTITLPAGTYTLTQGQLATAGDGEDITITGAGARTTTIEQTTEARVLEVAIDDVVNLSGVTIAGGDTVGTSNEPNAGLGGGVWVDSDAAFDLTDSTVTENDATASGGGIDNDGTLSVVGSTFSNNNVTGDPALGGGIADFGSDVNVENSTFSGNSASDGNGVGDGGGLYTDGDDGALTNDTFDGDFSDSGNSDELWIDSGTEIEVTNNIFYENYDAGTCEGQFIGGGGNISNDGDCTQERTDSTINPNLGPLQDNGGPTDTAAPEPGSPATNPTYTANTSNCPAADQRGVTRPNSPSTCDVGAVEGTQGPEISDEFADAPFDTSATVGADVDPNGADTTYLIEYGTTNAYGSETSTTDMGTTANTVQQTLAGLQPDTAYHFRLDATNANGTSYGEDDTFTTGNQYSGTAGTLLTATNIGSGFDRGASSCPTETIDWGDGTTNDVETTTCTAVAGGVNYQVNGSHTYAAAGHYDITVGVTQPDQFGAGAQIAAPPPPTVTGETFQSATTGSATLQASINPNGVATTYVVQYGLTSSYGQQTTAASAGSGNTASAVNQTISGLTPNTTYHYQFVATNSGGTTDGTDATFTTAAQPPTVTGETFQSATTGSATLQASINPNGVATTYVVQYGLTSSYGQQTTAASAGSGNTASAVNQTISGLTPNTTYHYQFVATNSGGTTDGTDATFTTAAQPPTVTGETFQSATTGSATLQASINPNGVATTYVVQYGLTSSYGQQTTAASAGSGNTASAVNQTISGLTPNTTYHYQFVATNSGGTTDGTDATFTTAAQPPTVTGESLQAFNGNSATVEVSVNPNGVATTYVVQYGLTSSYGQQTAAGSAGSGTVAGTVSQALSGLTPSTVYHYRFVATNSGGTTNGTDQTFTTTTVGIGFANGSLPPPVQGVSADVLPYIGVVLVNGKPLLVGENIPFGATIDTTHGTVVIETEDGGVLQSMQFARGVFVLTQLSNGITLLTLQGGSVATVCGTSAKGTRQIQAAKKTHLKPLTVRSLWGNGHGHFEVKGHYAAATVRGTIFHVTDRCDGTIVRVRRGLVAVLDLATGKTVLVPAGKSFLVKA